MPVPGGLWWGSLSGSVVDSLLDQGGGVNRSSFFMSCQVLFEMFVRGCHCYRSPAVATTMGSNSNRCSCSSYT